MKQSKYIYLLAGPSGSGKSSVARKITEWYGFKEVWSYTERPPRYAGEPGHVFVTPGRVRRCWPDVRVYALQRLPLRGATVGD